MIKTQGRGNAMSSSLRQWRADQQQSQFYIVQIQNKSKKQTNKKTP